MRIIQRFPALLALLLLAACSDGTGPRALVGEWVNRSGGEASQSDSEWYRTELRLTFGVDGGYTWESITHASWGRPSDDLLGHGITEGRYEIRGDSLFLTATRSHGWDYLTGTWEHDPGESPPARFRMRIGGRLLILDFMSYPLDAPEEAQMVFKRD